MTSIKDICYDGLTIILSIADLATDVMVLLSFYYQSRTTFFTISIIILSIAHICYSLVFQIRYEIPWKWGYCWAMASFVILLPFSSIFSIIFLLTEDPKSWFSVHFEKCTKLTVDDGFEHTFFSNNKNRSKMAEWIIKKLSRHIGFLLESGLEALPQSLLQCIAIVYYKEANYVFIVSILLSMFSVMSKAVVLSRAIDIKTYIWTWLCIVIDFFGTFFTLSWVFYTNDTLFQPVFLGYFSIVGQIWCYKVMITILPVVAAGLFLWFSYYMLQILANDVCCQRNPCDMEKCCWGLWKAILGSIGILLLTPIGLIGLEIFCFTFVAFAVYKYCTDRWHRFNDKTVNDSLNGMIDFISKPSICTCNNKGDRMVRILALNYFLLKQSQYNKRYKDINELIDEVDAKDGVSGLQNVTYVDIRKNCYNVKRYRRANILPDVAHNIKIEAPDREDYLDCCFCRGRNQGFANVLEDCCEYVCFFWLFMIIFPVFVIGKLFQIIFPYVVAGYLFYYNHWSDIDLFQLVMLLSYVGLQIIWFILGIIVFRVNCWLWHLQTGSYDVYMNNPETVVPKAKEWYILKTSIPWIENFILEMYGKDIGEIILDYFHNIDTKALLGDESVSFSA